MFAAIRRYRNRCRDEETEAQRLVLGHGDEALTILQMRIVAAVQAGENVDALCRIKRRVRKIEIRSARLDVSRGSDSPDGG